MKEIPSKLQCAYCERHHAHGGECRTERSPYDPSGCLIFKADERGCIRNGDFNVDTPLYYDFPILNTWCKDWEIGGVDTQIRIKKIHGLKWDTKKGCLIVSCNIDYYINEFHENYEKPKSKPNLYIVK